MHFSHTAAAAGSSALASLSPSNTTRDTMDPIAELLQQLSGVRRSHAAQSTSSQLQQLQMQLQLERQQANVARQQQLERGASVGANRRSTPTNSTLANVVAAAGVTSSPLGPLITGPANNNANSTQGGGSGPGGASGGAGATLGNSQFLLSRVGLDIVADDEIMTREVERMERGQFVQDLLLSTLLMDKVDLSGDFLQAVEDEFYVPSDGSASAQRPPRRTRIWPYSEPPPSSELDPELVLSSVPSMAPPSVRDESSSSDPSTARDIGDDRNRVVKDVRQPNQNNSSAVMNGQVQGGQFHLNGLAASHCDEINGDAVNQRSTLNGSESYAGGGSDNDGLGLSPSADMLLVSSLSDLAGNSNQSNGYSSSAHQPGEMDQQSVLYQSHERAARRRTGKDGANSQNRRSKEGDPPPH